MVFEIACCILQGHLNVVIHSFTGPRITLFTHFQVHLVLQELERDHTPAVPAPPTAQGPQGSTHLERCCLLLVVQWAELSGPSALLPAPVHMALDQARLSIFAPVGVE